MYYTNLDLSWDKRRSTRPLYRLLQATNLSPKQIDVLYKSCLNLGQQEQHQAPLQIAAGNQFVPKTNRCIIQILVKPGTKATAPGLFTDCYRQPICPQTKRCVIHILIIFGTKPTAAGPFTDCRRLSIFI